MIRIYTGLPGSGKSYSMVQESVAWFRRDRPQVYSNMAGLRCPEAVYLSEINQLIGVGNGLLLLDEAGVFLSSRYWQKVSQELLMAFAQVRKNGLDLFLTAQHIARVDTVLRELTTEVVHCRKLGRFPWVLQQARDTNGKETLWRRLVKLKPSTWELYDTLAVIGIGGGTVGRGAAARLEGLSTVARRRLSAEDGRGNVQPWQTISIWERRGCAYELTPEARIARLYLVHRGHLKVGARDWPKQVRKEIWRRRWLDLWGLGPNDASPDCLPDDPWLAGHSPRDAQDLAKAEAEEELRDQRGRGGLRAVAGGRR